jgi:nucleoside-diphosphate-sugar epimerase
MSRILLTGASGFIGSHCLNALRDRGHELHAVVRGVKTTNSDGVTWHYHDLREPEQAAGIVAKLQPELLLHCAWIATPGVYAASPENMAWLQSTVAMVEAFGKSGGRRLLGVGTSAEYAPDDRPCVEDVTPISPSTVYGKSKAATWLAIQALAQHYGMSACWARLFVPYGPGDSPQRLIPYVTNSLAAGARVETTLGLQLRDFIFVRDAAELIVRLLLCQETGAFNVGTGVPSSIRSVVEYLADACGRRELVQFGARQPGPGDPHVLVADMAKVERRLGWSAATELRTGLDCVLATVRAAVGGTLRASGRDEANHG